MAPAVTARRGRGRSSAWKGSAVGVGEVVAQLTRMHAELAQRDARRGEHPHSRNCVMNLVVAVSDDRGRAAEASRVVEAVAATHPLRAVVVHLVPGRARAGGRIEAEVTAESRMLLSGAPIEREQILLHVRGEARRHLFSLVEPLLVPDVPTYLWWTGSPPLGDRDSPLGLADVLIVDSAAFARPFDSFQELAALAARGPAGPGVGDLQWARLRAWRETLAQVFAAAERRPLLERLSAAGVDYVGQGRGNRAGAALLVGWLASALGWRLQGARGDSAGAVSARLETAAGRAVDVELRAVVGEGLAEGEVAAVRVQGEAGGQSFSLAIARGGESTAYADLEFRMGDTPAIRQRLQFGRLSETELVLRLIQEARRDEVFLPALEAAAALLGAI